MSNRKHVRKIGYLAKIPAWVLVTALAISLLVTFLALRNNNLRMVELRNAVYTADKKNGDVDKALNDLRAYVYAHMNTNLTSGTNPIKPPIQLKYTYERLKKQAQDNANSQVYIDAQNYCQAKYPDSFSGGPRVPCITEYVTTHGQKAQEIPAALYQFDFLSPTWSPDFAGWSLVVSCLLLFVLLLRTLYNRLLLAYFRSQDL